MPCDPSLPPPTPTLCNTWKGGVAGGEEGEACVCWSQHEGAQRRRRERVAAALGDKNEYS